MNSIVQFGSGLSVVIAVYYCLSNAGSQRKLPPPEETTEPPPTADDWLKLRLAAIGGTCTPRGWMVTLSCGRAGAARGSLEIVDAEKLERIAGLLVVHERLRVLIEVGTDGPGACAQELQRKLSDAVLGGLIKNGGDPARIRARIREMDSSAGGDRSAVVRQLCPRIHVLFSDAQGLFVPVTEGSPDGSPQIKDP